MPARTVIRHDNARSPLPKAMNRATKGDTVHAQALPRATVIGNAAGCHTRYEDPGPSHLLLEEKSNKCAGPPCGVAIATSIYCTPSAVPGLPRRKCA